MKKLKVLFLTIASVSIVLLTGCQNAAGGNTDPVIDPVIDPVNYTVVFNSNGGSPVASISVAEGTSIGTMLVTTNTPLKFLEWYTDPEFTQSWNFYTDIVTRSMTLWTKTVITKITYKAVLDGVSAATGTMELTTSENKFYVTGVDNSWSKGSYSFNSDMSEITFNISESSDPNKKGNTTIYKISGSTWTWTAGPAFTGFGMKNYTTSVVKTVLETVEQ